MNPIPKGRPRMTRAGFTYTPKRTKDAEKEIAWQAKQEWAGEPLEGAVSVIVTFHVQMPKSWSQKKRNEHSGAFCAKKNGDIDNYMKLVFDALSGICFIDDSQIVEVMAGKVWAQDGKIVLMIEEI